MARKCSKSELNEGCERCTREWTQKSTFTNKYGPSVELRPGCIKGEISRSGGDIEPPACMISFLSNLNTNDQRPPEKVNTHEEQVNTHEEKVNTHESVHLENTTSSSKIEKVNNPLKEGYTPQGVPVPWGWDDLDNQILAAIRNHFHLRGIARLTGKQPSAISKRLRRMEKFGIIHAHTQKVAGTKCKMFTIQGGCSPISIHPEEGMNTHEVKFNMHCLSFGSILLSGMRPRGEKQYKTKSWVGEIFRGEDSHGKYTIRVTTKKVIIDLHYDLGVDTEANLLIRYHSIARDHLLNFSERYNLKLSEPTLTREPHRLLPGTKNLAEAVLGSLGGEIYDPKTGTQIDKSKGGEFELVGKAGKETAKNLFNIPGLAIVVSTVEQAKEEIKKEIQKNGNASPDIPRILYKEKGSAAPSPEAPENMYV